MVLKSGGQEGERDDDNELQLKTAQTLMTVQSRSTDAEQSATPLVLIFEVERGLGRLGEVSLGIQPHVARYLER